MSSGSTNRTTMPVDTLWLQRALLLAEGGMLWRGSGDMSGKMHCEEMVWTDVGLWPGAVTWASPVGSEQCWEQKEPCQSLRRHLTAGQTPDHSHEALQVAVHLLHCWGWLPAILPTAWSFPLHTHLSPPPPLPHAMHRDIPVPA